MKTTQLLAPLLAIVIAATTLAPANVVAQSSAARHRAATHRQKTKNSWRNAAIASGAAGVLGLATHNGTLTTLGAAGAGYSAYRYEQDRKSQNRIQHGHRYHSRRHKRRHVG